jgi:2-haloacid dehalogenase
MVGVARGLAGRVADAVLRTLTRGAITDDEVTHVLSGFAELPAQSDAEPPARVYRHALDRIGRPAGGVALVAVHAFDCHGAHRVGLTTGWASRLEGRYAAIFAPADVTGTDLVDVANGLLALPRNDRRAQAKVPSQVVSPYRAP